MQRIDNNEFTTPSNPGSAPFLIENVRLDMRANGDFTPSARAVVTAGLRTSGLLRSLPAGGARTLLMLLTFLTPNGHVHPTLAEIAAAFGEDERSARARMQRLITFVWQGQPVVREVQRELGSDSYFLAPHVAAVRDALPDTAALLEGSEQITTPQGGRDRIYAQTRRTYAIPRAVAERQVLDQLGHSPEESEDGPKGDAYRQLIAVGVPRETCDRLIRAYPAERLLRQLTWLPQRNARTPSKFVVAAIENDYDPPLSVLHTTGDVQDQGGQAVATGEPAVPGADVGTAACGEHEGSTGGPPYLPEVTGSLE